MKFFEFKSVNMKAFRTVVILTFAGLIVLLGFTVIGLVSRHGEGAAYLLVGVIGLALFLIKSFFRREFRGRLPTTACRGRQQENNPAGKLQYIWKAPMPPSFRMTNYNMFEDDYKTWTIE